MVATAWPPPVEVRPYGVFEFRAMASPCRIVADTEELARSGARLVDELEQRWSRFRTTSEVSALNRAGGAPCRVSPWTLELLRRAEESRRATDGWFNPYVHDRLVELGYGPGAGSSASATVDLVASPLPDGPIEILPEASIVRLPPGVRFDPGGIGKGLAADLVAEHLIAEGSSSAQVELGGDVRVIGESWTGGPWSIDVTDPHDASLIAARLRIGEGAAATSSVLKTTWRAGEQRRHHLIDPTTGLPSSSDLLCVTATSSRTWWAEVVAKVVLLHGSPSAGSLARQHRCAVLAVDRAGAMHTWDGTSPDGSGGWAR